MPREVEAFRSAVRDTFLGVGEPPVRSDDVRGKQSSGKRRGEGAAEETKEGGGRAGGRGSREIATFGEQNPRKPKKADKGERGGNQGGASHHRKLRGGYDKKQVHAFLDAAGIRLAAMESADRPAGPLVSEAILAGWAAWADSTTFSTRRWRDGYDKAEVDAFSRLFATSSSGSGEPL